MVGLGFGNFYVLYYTLSSVLTKLSCIKTDLEGEWTFSADDLNWLYVVYFCHSLNF